MSDDAKITLSIVANAGEIRGIPEMRSKEISIMRLTGTALSDHDANIRIKNMINQFHFDTENPIAMYNPRQNKDPLFVIGQSESIEKLRTLLGTIENLDTKEKVRIDRPKSMEERVYLLNLYLKYLAVQMFDNAKVSITAERGLSFLQVKEKDDVLMVAVYFRVKDGELLLQTKSENVYEVEKDPHIYDYVFAAVKPEYGAFRLKTFAESTNIQRYRKHKGKEGSVKSQHITFSGSTDPEIQRRDFERKASVGFCIYEVVKILRGGGINLDFTEVDSVSPGVSFRKNKKQEWQLKEDQQAHDIIAERIKRDGLWIRRTSSISDYTYREFARAVREMFADTLTVNLFTDDDDKFVTLSTDFRFGPLPDNVLAAYGNPKPYILPMGADRCCTNKRNKKADKEGNIYRKIKSVTLMCVPGTGDIHLDVSADVSSYYSVHPISGTPSGEWDREVYDAVSVKKGRYELILQADESDGDYRPSLNRQYITVKALQEGGRNALKTCIRELLCVKADLLEGKIRSSARDLTGISLFLHFKGRKQCWNKKLVIGEKNRILGAPFTTREESYMDDKEECVILSLPDGRVLRIRHAKDVRQIIAPLKDEHASLSRALAKDPSDYAKNIYGNTDFRRFEYDDRQFYLVGYDNSSNYLQGGYAFYPAIYEVEKLEDPRNQMTMSDEDWFDLIALCYTPLVSSQRDASVYPFLKKYLDEMIRVSPEYLEAKRKAKEERKKKEEDKKARKKSPAS